MPSTSSCACSRARPERDGGGRRGPVHLFLARGADLEHPRLRERLPGRARVAPGGELPLHPGHPRRRLRPRGPQPAAQGQDPARGQGRGGQGGPLRGPGRVRGGGPRGPGDRGRPRSPGRGPLPDERAEPALRRGAAAAADPLRGGGGRGLLRAQGGEGHPRLPAARGEPRGRRGLAPGAERARRAASARAPRRRSNAWPPSAASRPSPP